MEKLRRRRYTLEYKQEAMSAGAKIDHEAPHERRFVAV
jgi:hypothetical protein